MDVSRTEASRVTDSAPPSGSGASALCDPAHSADDGAQLLELGPGGGHEHRASVVMLHGFGETAAEWFVWCMWLAQRLPHARFVLPTAPTRAGMGTTSWAVYAGETEEERRKSAEHPDWADSAAAVGALVEAEVAKVGAGNVVVAGFSQGGSLAYHLGLLREDSPVAGVAALSTSLRGDAAGRIGAAARKTSVFIGHGTDDDRVPLSGAEEARGKLQKRGVSVEYKVYQKMGHNRRTEEMMDLLRWLRRVIPGEQPPAEPAGEYRVAPDGCAYSKEGFIEYFGGTDEWDAARPLRKTYGLWEAWTPPKARL